MSITGLPGQGPVRVGIAINDTSAGILLANGIVLALLERERSGEGQWVHTSLIEAQLFMLDFQAARWLMKGEVAGQEGNFHPTSPGTGMFQTADGYINIAASGDNLWKRFCEVAGDKALASNPDFATVPLRAKNRPALIAHLNDIVRSKPSAYWVEALNKAGVPCGPINTIDKAWEDPQIKHLGMAKKVQHPKIGEYQVVGQPIHMSRYPQPETLRPTPDQGQHTDEVVRRTRVRCGSHRQASRKRAWFRITTEARRARTTHYHCGAATQSRAVFLSLTRDCFVDLLLVMVFICHCDPRTQSAILGGKGRGASEWAERRRGRGESSFARRRAERPVGPRGFSTIWALASSSPERIFS